MTQVLQADLLPPSWYNYEHTTAVITPDRKDALSRDYRCPTAKSTLGAFAAVNIIMGLLLPIIGRRDVIKKLSLGLLGRRGSLAWIYTGPIGAALHVLSNVVGAAIIKATPGFSALNIGQVILLWTTRPRVSWMIVCLVPFQKEDAIYLSVTTSTLVAELIMQVLSAYYMIYATNFARKQKFYLGSLMESEVPQAKATLLMYAGSILWITAITFAIGSCLWSILGVGDSAKLIMINLRARLARRHVRYLS